MVRNALRIVLVGLLFLFACLCLSAQSAHPARQRRPSIDTEVPPVDQKQPTYQYFSILDGLPEGLELHHDTQVGTGKPVDVYQFPIELQVLNSDGDLEPEGLIIDNFYTAKAVNPNTAPNPYNARDCKTWNTIVLDEVSGRNPNLKVWPYVEFTVAYGARIVQTNEDGPVYWSDDIECWGSQDRFPPF